MTYNDVLEINTLFSIPYDIWLSYRLIIIFHKLLEIYIYINRLTCFCYPYIYKYLWVIQFKLIIFNNIIDTFNFQIFIFVSLSKHPCIIIILLAIQIHRIILCNFYCIMYKMFHIIWYCTVLRNNSVLLVYLYYVG